jgi:NAD+ synthase (glutamine-hydrolysing)
MPERLPPLRLALAQLNPRVGDLEGNAAKITEYIERARDEGAELVVFPELVLTGYPPEDLLLKEHFLRATQEALAKVAESVEGIVAVVGYPERTEDVFDSIAVIADGAVRANYRKMRLWNYGVADEERYFQAGPGAAVIELGEARIGLTICEDMWVPGAPASEEAEAGAALILNPSGSPYHRQKGLERERMLIQRARDNLAAVAFANLVGGQDELVFDGHSLLIDHEGTVLARAPQFAEALVVATVDPQAALTARLRDTRLRPPAQKVLPEIRRAGRLERPAHPPVERVGGQVAELMEPEQEVYAALCLAVRDYVEKNGFGHVVIGLSGGIDSTLVALVAADALGPDRVTCVVMPSQWSSEGTQSDARRLAANLGVETFDLPIAPAMEVYEQMLADRFEGREPDIAEENLQARIRGNLLMALSNKFGWLVLTTGNKSEVSVGYSTLYGDTAGGFAVIKDVPKTLVYRLVDFRNARDGDHPVPQSIIDRPPSAELRADQKDSDSLPDYDMLDAILEAYVEEDADREQLLLAGFPEDAVDRVIALVDRAEYKRRQQPPGVKITPRAFGRDRRMPITNAYRLRPGRPDGRPAGSTASSSPA